MLRQLEPAAWSIDSGRPGPKFAITFGVHGNERPPIEAGAALVAAFRDGGLELTAGALLLALANPKAAAEDERWSEGGVDLNRCFRPDVLAREPQRYEESRARELARLLDEHGCEGLVDFHCTVEPGERFLMQHPPVDHEASRRVWRLLAARVLLTDPDLTFGGVSLDEHMTTRGLVGICYETGWARDPENTAERVLGEMKNVLAGLGMIAGVEARTYDDKELLQLDDVVTCDRAGFAWSEGVGENLQQLPEETVLGAYEDGPEVVLANDAFLIFPKKRPELVQVGKPLVYLASRV